MVSNVSGNGTAEATINLIGVGNQQTINITLYNLNDGLGVRDLVIPMTILFGDTTGDGVVNSSDVSQTKEHANETLSAVNFREDVTADGVIDSFDVSDVKAHSGTGLVAELVQPETTLPQAGRTMPQLP